MIKYIINKNGCFFEVFDDIDFNKMNFFILSNCKAKATNYLMREYGYSPDEVDEFFYKIKDGYLHDDRSTTKIDCQIEQFINDFEL